MINLDKLRLVDVGGAGGLHDKWLRVADQIAPVLFEPNPSQAEALRQTIAAQVGHGIVLETALFNTIGRQTLNLASYWGCTSLRKPNMELLSRYRLGPIFEIVGAATVECTRYDALHQQGAVPAPDVIKVDVQGCEYEVLQGFGGLLQSCVAIELETHFYPVYLGQKLLPDLVAYLAEFGFVLRRVDHVPSFDTDLVECDAFFTKNIEVWRGLDESAKRKLKLFCDVCSLVDYSRIDPAANHYVIAPP